MPDGTPELAGEPAEGSALASRGPFSRRISVPDSDSSNAASVAEDDDLSDDALGSQIQNDEGISGPAFIEYQGPTGLTKEEKDADETAYSEMASTKPVESTNGEKSGAGSSQHPIDLDDDFRQKRELIIESDDDGPEVIRSIKLSAGSILDLNPQTLPYGYTMNVTTNKEQAKALESDSDHDTGNSEAVEDSDVDVPEATDPDDPEDLEQDEISCSVEETDDEEPALSEVMAKTHRNKAEVVPSSDTLDASQSELCPNILVEDSQWTRSAPSLGTAAIPSISHDIRVRSGVDATLSSLSERAPSPSDAAMAKTRTATSTDLWGSNFDKYTPRNNIWRYPQHSYERSRPFADNYTATVNETDIRRIYTNTEGHWPVQVHHDRRHPSENIWDAPNSEHTYSDGPFRLNHSVYLPVTASDHLPEPVGQTAPLDLQPFGQAAAHSFYGENDATKAYDVFLQASHRPVHSAFRQPEHRDKPISTYFNIQNEASSNLARYIAPEGSSKVNGPENPSIALKPTSPLSIDALVDKESPQTSAQVIGTKRKAEDMSSTNNSSSYSSSFCQSNVAETNVEDLVLSDAQPRAVSDFVVGGSPSQSTQTSSELRGPIASRASREVRPYKRVKTLAKWVGTTIAVGVGAMVALTASAPQYMWDEVDREMGSR